MNQLRVVAVCATLIALFGCASSPTVSEAQRNAIRTISIAKDIPLPVYPVVWGPEANKSGLLLGPIGSTLTAQTENPDSVRFRQHLQENKIDVEEILRQEALVQLAPSRGFPPVVSEGGDAIFALAIEQYGLGPGFSMSPINKPLRPSLRVNAKLFSPKGEILWQGSEYITPMASDMPAYTTFEYYGNPARAQEGFRRAAEIVVKGLLTDMSQKMGYVAP